MQGFCHGVRARRTVRAAPAGHGQLGMASTGGTARGVIAGIAHSSHVSGDSGRPQAAMWNCLLPISSLFSEPCQPKRPGRESDRARETERPLPLLAVIG